MLLTYALNWEVSTAECKNVMIICMGTQVRMGIHNGSVHLLC